MRLNNLDYLQLRLVEEALDRIHTGDYGVCLSCEKSIPPKRLQALPWAQYCVTCQQNLGRFQQTETEEMRAGQGAPGSW